MAQLAQASRAAQDAALAAMLPRLIVLAERLPWPAHDPALKALRNPNQATKDEIVSIWDAGFNAAEQVMGLGGKLAHATDAARDAAFHAMLQPLIELAERLKWPVKDAALKELQHPTAQTKTEIIYVWDLGFEAAAAVMAKEAKK